LNGMGPNKEKNTKKTPPPPLDVFQYCCTEKSHFIIKTT